MQSVIPNGMLWAMKKSSKQLPSTIKKLRLAVIGLGYVGLPLALALSKNFKVTGFDISKSRIKTLKNGEDINNESSKSDVTNSSCFFTDNEKDLKNHDIYIVTVPTPIDEANHPDLSILASASQLVGKYISKKSIVVYESTVYPGVTENFCAPILSKVSGLKSGKDYFLGYSPERINPGDKVHTLEAITKVVAGQTPKIASLLKSIYGTINKNNIYVAKDIKTAEAAKAIENAQRDINIAFINEVALIANKMGLSALDILEAAGTKWNFLRFTPGLVGGHCIGVDPYYLALCSRQVGHIPDVILSGRRINDIMGREIANLVHDSLMKMHGKAKSLNILVLGFTFKENVSDTRNTKVNDLTRQLSRLGHKLTIHDPLAHIEEAYQEYKVTLTRKIHKNYDAIVLAVPHTPYINLSKNKIESLLKPKGLVYDLKGIWKDHKFKKNITYKKI